MVIFEYLVVGAVGANCYIIGCEETGEGVVVDPGGDGPAILRLVRERGLKVKYIIDTHGHVDHISANGQVKEATGAPILIHELDAPMLTDASRNLSFFAPRPVRGPAADRTLRNGEVVQVGNLKLEVIHTPGHTPGGISLRLGDKVLTGDTLFAGSIGRTDFPGGSYTTLIDSIKQKLLPLGDEIEVYPGHGPPSTIGEERATNPFLTGSW